MFSVNNNTGYLSNHQSLITSQISDVDALEVALSIGKTLASDALWDNDRCNWVGPNSDVFLGALLSGYGTLGPNLYDGTAGIALFLAQLYRLSDDPVIGATALGAMRHALSRLGDIPDHVRFGLHTGHVGIAYAALKVGEILDDQAIIRAGKQLMLDVLGYAHDGRCILDVMMGFGGAIPAILSVRDQLSDDAIAEPLLLWGEALLDKGQRGQCGMSWDTTGEMLKIDTQGNRIASLSWMKQNSQNRTQPNLIGYAHGAGGIALSLLELHHVFGETRFLSAAQSAFDYEDSWFDAGINRWLDLRYYGTPEEKKGTHVAWCHGAAGIGLARMNAWRLTGDVSHKKAATRAVNIVCDSISETLTVGTNFCLCHGLAGNAEILMDCDDDLMPQAKDMLNAVAAFGFENYHRQHLPWAYGYADHDMPPGLMTGLAGTGYFYLRYAQPKMVPSVLQLSSLQRSEKSGLNDLL